MLKELKGIYNPTIREIMERGLVSSLIGTKARFGWGVDKKKAPTLAEELHKPIKRKIEKRRVLVNGIDRIWAADLVDMQAFSKFNRGVKYLLAVIDVLSKYGWLIPLKDKTGKSVASALKTISNMTREFGSINIVHRKRGKIYVILLKVGRTSGC